MPVGCICRRGGPWFPSQTPLRLSLPQHPDAHRPERPVFLAIDEQLGEGAALRVAPELSNPGRLARSRGASGRGAVRRGGAGPRALRRSRIRRSSSSGLMVEGYAETVALLTGTGTLDPGQPARPSPACRPAKLEFELVATSPREDLLLGDLVGALLGHAEDLRDRHEADVLSAQIRLTRSRSCTGLRQYL